MTTLLAFVIIIILLVVISLLPEDTRLKQKKIVNIEMIDELLPQTQCGDCGFSGCRPYADALVNNKTEINRCLPGGDELIRTLSSLLGNEIKPRYKNRNEDEQKRIAIIDETCCIGCTKCVAICPVDAIIGAAKQMHSVINQYCTGCRLCIDPCPIDCIDIIVLSQSCCDQV